METMAPMVKNERPLVEYSDSEDECKHNCMHSLSSATNKKLGDSFMDSLQRDNYVQNVVREIAIVEADIKYGLDRTTGSLKPVTKCAMKANYHIKNKEIKKKHLDNMINKEIREIEALIKLNKCFKYC